MAQIKICDICGRNIKVETRYLWTGEEHMDASGNGYEKEYIVKDICSDCINKSLEYAMGFQTKNPLADWIKEHQRFERIKK